ncbi:EpsG family protein, partial [Neobacillus drentensis]|uniref:EpsG family protein n=1 Tax=Neobacillus drentensis TaxID=220684 RepID=UPI003001C2F1
GLRNNIGDTYFYMHSYSIQKFNFDIDINKDFGFSIIQAFLQKVSYEPQILIFFCALITNVLIVWTIYKYSTLIDVSIFVYITSGIYLVTMNGIRQYLAASISFVATKYIIQRDWKKYFLIVLLASTIHKSALILIPAYFIVCRKAWRAQTFLILLVGIFVMIAYNQISALIFGALEETQYGHYENFSEGGASVLRVLVYASPLLISFMGRKRLERINPESSDVIINMSLIGLFFMVISTQNWIFARMAIYFNL